MPVKVTFKFLVENFPWRSARIGKGGRADISSSHLTHLSDLSALVVPPNNSYAFWKAHFHRHDHRDLQNDSGRQSLKRRVAHHGCESLPAEPKGL